MTRQLSHYQHVATSHRLRAEIYGVESSLTGEQIKLLFDKSDGHCAACFKWFGLALTVDHIIPLSLGGPNSLENCVLVCKSCNSKKSNRIKLSTEQEAEARKVQAYIKRLRPPVCITSSDVLISVGEVAERLDVTRYAVYRYVRRGLLRVVKIKRNIVTTETEFERFRQAFDNPTWRGNSEYWRKNETNRT